MIREIITYPDRRLFMRSNEVESFDSELHKLLDDMYETMIAKNGIGLAAIQVAVPLRALIINLPDEEGKQHKEDLLELINPVIIESKGTQIYTEGCLSVPEYYEDVERAEWVRVEYQDRFGNKKSLETDGLLAVAVQHEMDHLDGHLFIEKLPYLKRKKFEKEWKKKRTAKKSGVKV
ncbi:MULTISPECIES: peptide deformylase [Nitratiruptor]|uniref:Peptide deformylase n=1 Tax=Nitratiruptor tergarcus DSM 16512 TaxID=1069081 RepID=A0A1W1WRB0_9BACT|nr:MULTISPECIES: peptide deformylase [Nitratiruptor]BCD61350.1 peptide deformylase [Nitratiruptor sp. YY08-13]BCD65283.1 peptide deformylase [Nitratiruptor sp. YY08-26]SMC08851.1 peptide deformylase [Nitratiruptor tergarcus DSM 16512]